MNNHRPVVIFVRPLLVVRSADSLDSRWPAQHPDTLIRRHPGSELTVRDRRLRLKPRVLWHALVFRFSGDHRQANEQYERAYAD